MCQNVSVGDTLHRNSSLPSDDLVNYHLGLSYLSHYRLDSVDSLLQSYPNKMRLHPPLAVLSAKLPLFRYEFSKVVELTDVLRRYNTKDSLFLKQLDLIKTEALLLNRLYKQCLKVAVLKSYEGPSTSVLDYINASLLDGIGHLSSTCFETAGHSLRVLSIPNSAGGRSVAFAYQLGNGEWESPRVIPINGLDPSGVIAYPYLMPDGVTLYFAYKSSHTLNSSYDLYVSRYSREKGAFLVPQLLGMPFNSLADDYLYLPSEDQHQVWLLSNRGCSGERLRLYHLYLPLSSESATDSTVMTVERALLKDTLISSIPPLPVRKSPAEVIATERAPLVVVEGHPIYTLGEVSDESAAQILKAYLDCRKGLLREETVLAHLRQKLIDNPSRAGDVTLVGQLKALEQSVQQRRKQMRALLASFVATYKP